MRHKITTKPVRVHSFDKALVCDTVRIVGFRAACTCGERGPVRRSVREAREAFRDHGVPVGTKM